MERKAIITSNLVDIFPLSENAFEDLKTIACDERVWDQHPAKQRGTPDGFRAFFDESLCKRTSVCFFDKSKKTIAGMSSYFDLNLEEKSVEIGWTFIGYDWWATGFNTHIKTMMIEYARQEWGVNKIYFYVAPENLRSQKAVLKLGAIQSEKPIERTILDKTSTVIEFILSL